MQKNLSTHRGSCDDNSHEQLINAEKLASLGRMASGIAHELEEPLKSILRSASELMDQLSGLDPAYSEGLSNISEEARKCLSSVQGLQDFSSRKAEGSLLLSVNEIIRDTVSLIKNQPRFFSIIFDMQLDDALAPVRMDPAHLRQVIINLLMNASDAMDKHGAMKIITRCVETEGRAYAEMEFSDSGPGILPEDMGRVFEPFFTTKYGKGTGLGLSVSYGIAKKYGGEMAVKSVPDEGASFFVRLPLDSDASQDTE